MPRSATPHKEYEGVPCTSSTAVKGPVSVSRLHARALKAIRATQRESHVWYEGVRVGRTRVYLTGTWG